MKIAKAYVRVEGKTEVIFVAVPEVSAEEILNRLKRGSFNGQLLAYEEFTVRNGTDGRADWSSSKQA